MNEMYEKISEMIGWYAEKKKKTTQVNAGKHMHIPKHICKNDECDDNDRCLMCIIKYI